MPVLKKFKRGTQLLYNGNQVFVWKDKEDGTVQIADNKEGNYSIVVSIDELEELRKPRTPISSKPKPLTAEQQVHKSDLNAFYDTMAESVPFHCENCKKPLYAITNFFKRCVTAHILPKAEFESVATNPDNILFLGWEIIGVCCCHDDWDRKGKENRSTMPIYPKALKQFQKLKENLTSHELVKAYDYLNINGNEK